MNFLFFKILYIGTNANDCDILLTNKLFHYYYVTISLCKKLYHFFLYSLL